MILERKNRHNEDCHRDMRNNIRHICENTIELKDNAETVAAGTLRDLGVSSLYMFTSNAEKKKLSTLTPAKLQLKMYSGGEAVSIQMCVRVLRSDDKGVALQLTRPVKSATPKEGTRAPKH